MSKKKILFCGAIVALFVCMFAGAYWLNKLVAKECVNICSTPRALAVEALPYYVANATEIKIRSVSEPDSIFENQFLSSDEQMYITDRIIELSNKLEEIVENGPDIISDAAFYELVNRQTKVRAFMMRLPAEEVINKGSHKGWKVKIEYECKTLSDEPYRSEYWFFMDKDNKFIYDSFEIPIL